ncbi:MAG: hypothetical protein M3R17_14460 [Bacteroidota bacterium]|nr:hypothetical protein [Bacteroidota bacterium]
MKQRFLPAFLLIPAFAFALALNSCGNDDGTNGTDSTGSDTAAVNTDSSEATTFDPGVPSPSEIFAFMKAAGSTKADGSLLNSPDNEKKYDSKKAQSLNLGIYSADLLYCSTFNVSNKVVAYFGACMRMGDKLKVATNLSEKDKERISKNAGNGDSLVAISNDLYLSSFENLENNQRGGDLSLMLAGGWVESLYLMSNMVKDFEKDKATAERVHDQRLSLDNLVEFMEKHADNDDVKSVLAQMKELQVVMNEASASANTDAPKMKNGKRVIGGGSKSGITKEQFEKIKTKIGEIRNGFVNAQ